MWYRLERIFYELQGVIDRMDREQWIVVSLVAVVLGAIFLQGFGSRSTY